MPTPSADDHDANAQAMLVAAWRLLCDSMFTPAEGKDRIALFEQLRAEDVAREAGLSSGAFYNRWRSREDFLQAMIDFSLSSERLQEFESAVVSLGTALQQGVGLRDLTKAGTAANLAWVENDPTFAVEVYLWSLCRARPELVPKLKAMYDEVLDRWQRDVYLPLVASFGLEFRPPFDVEVFSRVLAALAEGLAMQRAIDPSLPLEIFGWAVLALMPAALRGVNDQRSLEDLWEEAEGYVEDTNLLRVGGSLDPASILELRSLTKVREDLVKQVQAGVAQLAAVDERIVGLLSRGSAATSE